MDWGRLWFSRDSHLVKNKTTEAMPSKVETYTYCKRSVSDFQVIKMFPYHQFIEPSTVVEWKYISSFRSSKHCLKAELIQKPWFSSFTVIFTNKSWIIMMFHVFDCFCMVGLYVHMVFVCEKNGPTNHRWASQHFSGLLPVRKQCRKGSAGFTGRRGTDWDGYQEPRKSNAPTYQDGINLAGMMLVLGMDNKKGGQTVNLLNSIRLLHDIAIEQIRFLKVIGLPL